MKVTKSQLRRIVEQAVNSGPDHVDLHDDMVNAIRDCYDTLGSIADAVGHENMRPEVLRIIDACDSALQDLGW